MICIYFCFVILQEKLYFFDRLLIQIAYIKCKIK